MNKIGYTYQTLVYDINNLEAMYPFLETGAIGQSVLGRNLCYIRLGEGPVEVFYNGAHHALEWITSSLLMRFIQNFLDAYSKGGRLRGCDLHEIWRRSSIYIVPMINPDGVNLVLEGLNDDNPFSRQLISWNMRNTDFSTVWQANIRGVDLNHNYNASWELSRQAEPKYGIFGPGPTRYSGPYPESEPESKAVADFTRSHDFRLVLAYHSQGREIFWNYMNMASDEAEWIGMLFVKASGYSLSETAGMASYAGYKDWFMETYRRPGYTIEVGSGKNPLPVTQLDEIYCENEELLLLAAVVP